MPLVQHLKRPTASIPLLWLLILAFLGYLGSAHWHAYHSYQDRTGERALSIVRLVEEHASAKLDRANASLIEVLDRVDARDFGKGMDHNEPRRQVLQQLLAEQQRRTPGIVSISLTDKNGLVFANSLGVPPGTNLGTRQYFLDLKNGTSPEPVISEVIKGRVSNKWGIQIARRFLLPDGSFGGMIVANLGLAENFEEFYRSVNLDDKDLITLRNRENRVLVRYPVREDILGKVVSGTATGDLIQTNPSEAVVLSKSTIDGISRITAVRKLAGYPIYAIVGLSRDDALKPWRDETSVALLMALGVMLAGALLTASLKQRERLNNELSLLSFALNRVEEAAFLADEEGRLCYVNDAACRSQGRTREQLLALNVTDIDQSITTPAQWQENWQRIKTQVSTTFESVHLGNGGRAYPVEVNANYFEFQGRPYILGLVRDIAERKKIERRMQLAQEVFDSASEAIFVSDLEGRLLDVNAEACRLSQYPREELLKLRNVDIVATDELPYIASELEKCDDGEVSKKRWLLRCADGSTVPLDLVVQRLQGDLYLAVGRDLTTTEKVLKQLSEARDEAEAANRAKSRFLAAASHDLRQPIQAIHLFHSALNRTALDEEQRRITDFLARSVQSLADILNTLLDISKLDAGMLVPAPAALPVVTLMEEIEAEYAAVAAAKGLRFKLFYPETGLYLFCDHHLLQSLLRNLIDNAIKYTTRGGLLIAVRRQGAGVLVQVWDSGIGIAPEHLPAIFDEYFQVDNPQRDRTRGLGLGLSIAKRLARLLGTAIRVNSRQDKGSVFSFHLPLAEEADTPKEPAPHGHHDNTENDLPVIVGQRIAVIEDDAMSAAAITVALESLGFVVTTYASAEDAMANPAITGADFYISDFRLPGVNGWDFLDWLQGQRQEPLKALLLTGESGCESIAGGRYIPWKTLYKPISLDALKAAMVAIARES